MAMFVSRNHVVSTVIWRSLTAFGRRVVTRRPFSATYKPLPVRDRSLTFSHQSIRHISSTSPSLNNSASRDQVIYYRTITEPPATVDYVSQPDNGSSPDGVSAGAAKESVTYNAVWLRENCRCAECYNSTTAQRNVLFHHLTPQAFDAMSVTTTEGHSLEVLWADGHVSRYRRDWLDSYCIQDDSAEKPLKTPSLPEALGARRRLWDRHLEVDAELERVDFEQLTATGSGNKDSRQQEALKALLGNLLRFGFAFVDNVPSELESTITAATTISPALRTFYGEYWEFGKKAETEIEHSNMDFHDTAYLNVGIGVHTDGTYWTLPPGIQVFHCVDRDVDGQGGETRLVDGFHAAERLREVDKDSFELLTRVRLGQRYIEPGKFRYQSFDTVLRVFPSSVDGKLNKNGNGELEWIRYNHYDRSPVITSSTPEAAERLGDIYRALGRLGNLLDSPESELRFRLTPGRVLLLDNWRVLHGRTAFTGQRLVCGCYLPRDEWISRAQTLNLL